MFNSAAHTSRISGLTFLVRLRLLPALKDFNLKISEIKKAERFAAKESGKTCFIAAMSYSGADVFGWQDVLCEMDSAESGEYVSTVHLCVYMNDRRRSYVARVMPTV